MKANMKKTINHMNKMLRRWLISFYGKWASIIIRDGKVLSASIDGQYMFVPEMTAIIRKPAVKSTEKGTDKEASTATSSDVYMNIAAIPDTVINDLNAVKVTVNWLEDNTMGIAVAGSHIELDIDAIRERELEFSYFTLIHELGHMVMMPIKSFGEDNNRGNEALASAFAMRVMDDSLKLKARAYYAASYKYGKSYTGAGLTREETDSYFTDPLERVIKENIEEIREWALNTVIKMQNTANKLDESSQCDESHIIKAETAKSEIDMNRFMEMWRDLMNQSGLKQEGVVDEELVYEPKYFNTMVKIESHSAMVPEDKRRDFYFDRSTFVTALWILKHKMRGIDVINEDYTFAAGNTVTMPIAPVRAHQIWSHISELPEGIEEADEGMRYQVSEQMLAEAKFLEAEKGVKVVNFVQDFILYIDPKEFNVHDGIIEHFKRLKAPALMLEDGSPAYLSTDIRFFDSLNKDVVEMLERHVDGVTFVRYSQWQMNSPVPMPAWLGDREVQYTARITDIGEAADGLDMGEELGKSGMTIVADDVFDKIYYAVTGRNWDLGAEYILCPKKTIKNFAGNGVRRKLIIIHATGWEYSFSKDACSSVEHMVNDYTDVSFAKIMSQIITQVTDTCERLNKPELFIEWFRDNVQEIVDEFFNEDDQERKAQSIAKMVRIVSNAKDWIAKGFPVKDVIRELVDFIVKKISRSFTVREDIVRMKTAGFLGNLPEGIDCVLPVDMYLDREGRVPAEWKPFVEIKDDHYIVHLKAMYEHHGRIKLKRPPVINGAYTSNGANIQWRHDTNCAYVGHAMSVAITSDNDGDYLLASFSNFTKDMGTFQDYLDELFAAKSSFDKTLDIMIKGGAELPQYDGQADALADVKKDLVVLKEKYPNNPMITVVLSKCAGNEVGSTTNSISHTLIQMRQYFEGTKHERKALVMFHHMYRQGSEGFIQAMKHLDTIIPIAGASIMEYAYLFMRSIGLNVPAFAAAYKYHDTNMRKGVNLDRVCLIANRKTYSSDHKAQWFAMLSQFKEVAKWKRNKNPNKPRLELRIMNTREKMILTQYTYNGMASGKKETTANDVWPIFLPAVKALDVKFLGWINDRDKEHDEAAKKAMTAVIKAEDIIARQTSREFSTFYREPIREDGTLWFDKARMAGNLLASYFMGYKEGSPEVFEWEVNKEEGIDLVKRMREFRPTLPIVALLVRMYLKAAGHGTPNVLMDGFEQYELNTVKVIINNFKSDSVRKYAPISFERFISLDGLKLIYAPDTMKKNGELWVRSNLYDMLEETIMPRYKTKKALRRALAKGQIAGSMVFTDKDHGVVTGVDNLSALRSNTNINILIEKETELPSAPPNVRVFVLADYNESIEDNWVETTDKKGTKMKQSELRVGITENIDAGINQSWIAKKDEWDIMFALTKCPSRLVDKDIPDNTIIHCTITGMGGTAIEPNAPSPATEIAAYHKLVEKYGSERVVLRIDPIIPTADGIAAAIGVYGQSKGRSRISILDMYKHAADRFRAAGLNELVDMYNGQMHLSLGVRKAIANTMPNAEVCGEPGFDCVGCVSDRDLKAIGIEYEKEDGKCKQRPACACIAEKRQIIPGVGKPCAHGCLYCFWRLPYTELAAVKTTVVNLRTDKYDVYIGRGSKWGNPFKLSDTMTREESIRLYREYITTGDGMHLLNDLHELKGKILGCYCKPLACHGDVLAELADK